MNGTLDRAGRALVDLAIRSAPTAQPQKLTAWIDTAFTGELVVPRSIIDEFNLVKSSAISAGLADGTQAILDTFSCFIEWFVDVRQIEVIESNGLLPLLGVGLLTGCRLEIDYRLATVAIN